LRNYTFKVYPEQRWADNSKASPNPFFKPKGQRPIANEPDTTQTMTPEILPIPQNPCINPPTIGGPICPPMSPPTFEPQLPPLAPPCPGPTTPFYQQPPYPYAPVFAPLSMRLAHAYVPWQYYNVVYGASEALEKGTLFPELCQPQGIYGPCEGPQPCGGVYYGC